MLILPVKTSLWSLSPLYYTTTHEGPRDKHRVCGELPSPTEDTDASPGCTAGGVPTVPMPFGGGDQSRLFAQEKSTKTTHQVSYPFGALLFWHQRNDFLRQQSWEPMRKHEPPSTQVGGSGRTPHPELPDTLGAESANGLYSAPVRWSCFWVLHSSFIT